MAETQVSSVCHKQHHQPQEEAELQGFFLLLRRVEKERVPDEQSANGAQTIDNLSTDGVRAECRMQ